MRKEEILMNVEREIENEQLAHIKNLVKDRMRGKPLSYITKSKEFFSEPFFVDERVLIPRPETELLVEEALQILTKKPHISHILDMGTGSGAIGIAISKRTGTHIVCVDISMEALSVARKNAFLLQASGSIHFVCSDLFRGIKRGRKFDMVLANLPYVSHEEWDGVMVEVRDFEPKIALYGGVGGTEVYERFAREIPHYLEKDGYVICEVGGDTQGKKIKGMLETIGLTVVVKKDLSDRVRMLTGHG